MNENKNTFKELSEINVSRYVKEKIGLKYLSWANAWSVLKSHFPDAEMKVYTREETTTKETTVVENNETIKTTVTSTNEVPYFTDGKTAYVKVGVVVNGVEYTELLPVMDNRNNAVYVAAITMTAVNKAIQRAFVKACARHGLGLAIYAGEDLPSDEKQIDFTVIGSNCDRYATTALSDDGFEQMKQDVIKLLQDSYPEDASKAIVAYTSNQAQGKRVSAFTNAEDSQRLQRIYNFVNEVKKAIAANNGR